MHQWYEEGLIDPDFVSVEATDIGGHDEELLRSDNIGVWWANANSISNYYSMCPTENFSIQPLNVYATDDHADHTSSVGRLFGNSISVAGTCLSATCSNPEAALAWLNFWYTEEGSMLQNYGVEGESYHLVDGKVEYTDVITSSSYGIEPTVALLLYSIGSAPWGVSIQERTWNFYSDVQIDAIETWHRQLRRSLGIPQRIPYHRGKRIDFCGNRRRLHLHRREHPPVYYGRLQSGYGLGFLCANRSYHGHGPVPRRLSVCAGPVLTPAEF